MMKLFSVGGRAAVADTASRGLRVRALVSLPAAASVWLGCAGPAHAQSAAPVYDWTGFYAGINAGVGGGVAGPVLDVSSPPELGFFGSSSTDHQNHRLGGAFLGGQAGYNYQFQNNVVVGVESDLQWSNIRALLHDDNTFVVTDGFPLSSVATSETKISQNWFGTTRLRLGYAFADRFLAYVTGGVAYSGFNVSNSGVGTSLSPPPIETFSLTDGAATSTRFGWTAGAGAEYALNNRLSLKSEYLYSQYSGLTAPYLNTALSTPAVTAGTYSSGTLGIHLLRAGLNDRLGDSGEVADIQPSRVSQNWTPVWNGFYAGVNGGYGAGVATPRLSETTLRQILPFGGGGGSSEHFISDDRDTLRSAGFLAGGQFGYNRRLPNKFVGGVETDLQWSGIRASNRSNVSAIDFFPPGDSPAFVESSSTSQINIRQNWFGTTRLRLGYQAFDRVLAYTTGGIAYAGFSADTSGALSGATIFDTEHGSTSGSGSSTRIGWTVGAGVEYAIAENLSFKSEYLYSQYSGFDFPYQRSLALDTFVNDTTQGTLSTGTLGIHLVRAGLNWKLGDPGH
jgi:outer membrane immunogenic protein